MFGLKQRGINVNHKKIQRIMKLLGLKCDKFNRKSRKSSSYKGTIGTIAKNRINRRFHTSTRHQKLTTDITEFKCSNDVKLYLNLIMDNGEILSYGISMRPTLELALKPLEEAFEIVKDSKYRTTLHSEQGWHYQHEMGKNTQGKQGIPEYVAKRKLPR